MRLETRTVPSNVLATRVVRRERSGSSLPVVVETDAGLWFTKLRGAAQGVSTLVSELIVAELATELALPVPARAFVTLPAAVPSDDVNDELRDLLDASVGVNVGFAVLESARNLTPAEYDRVPLEVAATVLWLDILVQNLDRSPANPNIMVRRGTYWLIDHGAALPFQHDWSAVREDSPHRPYHVAGHVFGWAEPILPTVQDTVFAGLTRERFQYAVNAVPDSFLAVLANGADHVERRRAMYVAYLWKRLQWMHEQYGPR